MSMDNELELGSEARRRIFHIAAYGDTAHEIEVAALAAAQEFFGDGVPLEVAQDYEIFLTSSLDPAKASKKYHGYVRVHALA